MLRHTLDVTFDIDATRGHLPIENHACKNIPLFPSYAVATLFTSQKERPHPFDYPLQRMLDNHAKLFRIQP